MEMELLLEMRFVMMIMIMIMMDVKEIVVLLIMDGNVWFRELHVKQSAEI